MSYDFEPFIERIRTNWYEDDPRLHALLKAYRVEGSSRGEQDLSRWGGRVAGRLRELAEESARPENRPRLRPYDAYGRRVDEIILPGSTRAALAEVEGRERLGAVHGDPFAFYTKIYLYAQNGEAGVTCSLACTDGLVRALEALGDRGVHEEIVHRVRTSTPERFYHGAQFVTEVQGGSDVSANRTLASPDGDRFRLHGRKWFCSNVNADYFLVTARPAPGADRVRQRGEPPDSPTAESPVGLFVVPAYAEEGGVSRNGYTIDRLKEKLGTRELATAELTFDGAIAYPVGPPERGLANLVAHVLVPSRFACVLSAASYLRQAERIVTAYTDFRTAFGRKLIEYPLVRETTETIRRASGRAAAVTFELLSLWQGSRDPGGAGAGGTEAIDFRVMLSLCKPVLTRESTRLLHEAMMLLGGNGIEERFAPLPRLYRDSVINETWEGPHNVLLTQALRDLLRHDVGAAEFVERVAGPDRSELARELGEILSAARGSDVTVRFAHLAQPLVTAFGDRVLAEAGLDAVDA